MPRLAKSGLRRWLRRFAAGVFCGLWVVLMLLNLFFWVQSYYRGNMIRRQATYQTNEASGRSDFFIQFERGRIFVHTAWRWRPLSTVPQTWPFGGFWLVHWTRNDLFGPDPPPPQTLIQRLGFRWDHAHGTNRTDFWSIRYIVWPHWFMTLVLAVPLPFIVWRWNQRRLIRSRRSAGLCTTCGYDLRASSGRCPECGAAITETAL